MLILFIENGVVRGKKMVKSNYIIQDGDVPVDAEIYAAVKVGDSFTQ